MIIAKIPPRKITLCSIADGECCLVDKIDFYLKTSCAGTGFKIETGHCLLVHLDTGALVQFDGATLVQPFVGSVQLR